MLWFLNRFILRRECDGIDRWPTRTGKPATSMWCKLLFRRSPTPPSALMRLSRIRAAQAMVLKGVAPITSQAFWSRTILPCCDRRQLSREDQPNSIAVI